MCNFALPSIDWTPCGKGMCPKHWKIEIGHHDPEGSLTDASNKKIIHWHCIGTDCEKKLMAIQNRRMKIFYAIVCLCVCAFIYPIWLWSSANVKAGNIG